MPSTLTQSELAQKLGVSQGTISYAFKPGSKIRRDTRERVLKAARDWGYRPHSAARAMASRKTLNIGVVIHSLGLGDGGGQHLFDTVSGINAVIEPAGYTTCLIQMADVEHGSDGVARVLREQALDGIIVTAALLPHIREELGRRADHVIWCDAGVSEPYRCLWRDERAAGRIAAEAAVAMGHRNILWVSAARPPGPKLRSYRHRATRYAGAREVFDRAGVRRRTFVLNAEPHIDAARLYRALRQCKCVVVSDLPQAMGLIHIANHLGLCPGHDYALACCDDRGEHLNLYPHLSRSLFDRFALGKRAAQMLMGMLEGSEPNPPSIVQDTSWQPGLHGNEAEFATLVSPAVLAERRSRRMGLYV